LDSMQLKTSFIWAEDRSGKLHFGTWSCMQHFAGEDKYMFHNPLLPEPTQTAISSVSFYCKPWLKKRSADDQVSDMKKGMFLK
jgi:hypothetical protein